MKARSHGAVIQHARLYPWPLYGIKPRSHGASLIHARRPRPVVEGRFWRGAAIGLLLEVVAFVFVVGVVILVLSLDGPK